MITVTVSLTSEKPFKHQRVLIDEGTLDKQEMRFVGDVASTAVAPGAHRLSWFVEGDDGQAYTLTMLEPSSNCSGPGTMSGGSDQGTCRFSALTNAIM